jgi:2-hydroxychromene-2-carboxylate isomerase
LHFFCSLRSPYTYIAIPRVRRLAVHYGATLRLRFVLPMVMRGLPVPREKRLYILHDTQREAELLGLPFGRIVDPVGRPTERGLAVLHRAVAAGRGPEFLESFMRGVWAEGLDGGDDRDLDVMAKRAGLESSLVTAALGDESWREVAARNREEMLARGLWGVPSFRVDEAPARWGQDRLWRVERDLIAATQATPVEELKP